MIDRITYVYTVAIDRLEVKELSEESSIDDFIDQKAWEAYHSIKDLLSNSKNIKDFITKNWGISC